MPSLSHKTTKIREIKLAVSAATKEFGGYLAGYGNIDQGGDVFEPGAFAASIQEIKSTEEWPPLLLNHGGLDMTSDDMVPVGLYLDLSEDDNGLKFQAKLADTSRGLDIYELMKMEPRPAIKGMSVGYIASKYTYKPDPQNARYEIRRITEAKLIEGSIVTFPMNKNAQVLDIKSSGHYDKRKLEAALRDVCGLSQSEAKAFIAQGFKALDGHRDDSAELREITSALRKNINILTA